MSTVHLLSKAINCCLEEIVPCDGKTWETCTERFISLVDQKVVTVVSVHSGVFMSELLSEMNLFLLSTLLFPLFLQKSTLNINLCQSGYLRVT